MDCLLSSNTRQVRLIKLLSLSVARNFNSSLIPVTKQHDVLP